jgi:hypothetical protein
LPASRPPTAWPARSRSRAVARPWWQGPILLLEGIFQAQDVPLLEQYRLTTAVHCEEQLRMLEARPKGPLAIQLKLNTGMNRLGFRPAQYRAAWERARTMSCIGSIVHMTHFSDADSQRGIAHQVEAFEAATANLPGGQPGQLGRRALASAGAPQLGAPASCSTADRPRGCRPTSPDRAAAGDVAP